MKSLKWIKLTVTDTVQPVNKTSIYKTNLAITQGSSKTKPAIRRLLYDKRLFYKQFVLYSLYEIQNWYWPTTHLLDEEILWVGLTYPSSYGSTPSSPPSLEHPNCELIPSYSYSSFCQYGSAVVQWYLVNICWCGVQAINWFWVVPVSLSVSLATSPCLRHYLAIIEKDPLTQPERTFCNLDIQYFCISDPVMTVPVWKGIHKAEIG